MLLFRSLDSFFDQLRQTGAEYDWDALSIPSDFENLIRTEADVQIGQHLLQYAQQLTEVERNDTLRFGIWLLSYERISEIATLLHDDEEYVREDAQRRLKVIKTLEAEQALKSYTDTFRQFVTNCAELLNQHGLTATVATDILGNSTIREFNLNFPFLYSKRNDADFSNYLVGLASRKKP